MPLARQDEALPVADRRVDVQGIAQRYAARVVVLGDHHVPTHHGHGVPGGDVHDGAVVVLDVDVVGPGAAAHHHLALQEVEVEQRAQVDPVDHAAEILEIADHHIPAPVGEVDVNVGAERVVARVQLAEVAAGAAADHLAVQHLPADKPAVVVEPPGEQQRPVDGHAVRPFGGEADALLLEPLRHGQQPAVELLQLADAVEVAADRVADAGVVDVQGPGHGHHAHHPLHAPAKVPELPVQGVHDAAGFAALAGHVRRVPFGAFGIGVVDVDVIADGRVVVALALVDGPQQTVPAAGPGIDLVHRRVTVVVALVLPADQVDELGDAVGDVVDGADDLHHLRVGGEHLVVLERQEDLVGDRGAVQLVGVRQGPVDPQRPVAPVDDAVAVVVAEEHHLHVERPHRARAHPVPVVVEGHRVASGAVGMALRQQGEVAVHEGAQPVRVVDAAAHHVARGLVAADRAEVLPPPLLADVAVLERDAGVPVLPVAHLQQRRAAEAERRKRSLDAVDAQPQAVGLQVEPVVERDVAVRDVERRGGSRRRIIEGQLAPRHRGAVDRQRRRLRVAEQRLAGSEVGVRRDDRYPVVELHA